MQLFTKTHAQTPKHVGIVLQGLREDLGQRVEQWVETAIKLKIPVLTVLVPTDTDEAVGKFVHALSSWQGITKYQVKISVLGRWYAVSDHAMQLIKQAFEKTKDYDGFFLNLCVNYDGQQEIVNSCKILATQVQSGKIDASAINESVVKENLFTSNFMPPEVIIVTGNAHCLHNFLLWDCGMARIVFTDKHWEKLSAKEFGKIVSRQQETPNDDNLLRGISPNQNFV